MNNVYCSSSLYVVFPNLSQSSVSLRNEKYTAVPYQGMDSLQGVEGYETARRLLVLCLTDSPHSADDRCLRSRYVGILVCAACCLYADYLIALSIMGECVCVCGVDRDVRDKKLLY